MFEVGCVGDVLELLALAERAVAVGKGGSLVVGVAWGRDLAGFPQKWHQHRLCGVKHPLTRETLHTRWNGGEGKEESTV